MLPIFFCKLHRTFLIFVKKLPKSSRILERFQSGDISAAGGEQEEEGDGGEADGGGQGPQGGQTSGQGNFSLQLDAMVNLQLFRNNLRFGTLVFSLTHAFIA